MKILGGAQFVTFSAGFLPIGTRERDVLPRGFVVSELHGSVLIVKSMSEQREPTLPVAIGRSPPPGIGW